MTKEELEKEAGFAETKMLINCNGDYSKKQDYKKDWQDGAEFGYNKAKEEGKVVVEHFEAYGQCRDSRKIASLETENAELKDKLNNLSKVAEVRLANWQKYEKELKSEKEYNATLRKEIDEYTNSHTLCAKYKELKQENAELKERAVLSIDCERCKNCIKCECGYYQLGEIKKDEQLTKVKDLIRALLKHTYGQNLNTQNDFNLYLGRIKEAEQFLKEIEND